VGDDIDSDHTARRRSTVRLVTGALTLLVLIPACSSSSTPTATSQPTTTSTTTASPVTTQQGSAAEVAACQADAKSLEVALAAYMAQKGAYPSPPSAWSASTYAANFEPLMSAAGGGPYLASPPADTSYVIEYDSAGHVWIAPPGAYGATYNPGQSFDANPNICLAAVG
jgi:hypothetical protein